MEWYKDTLVKEWGKGKIRQNIGDSMLLVSFSEIWSSDLNSSAKFIDTLRVHKANGYLELSGYSYRTENKEILSLIRRVKSLAKFKKLPGR